MPEMILGLDVGSDVLKAVLAVSKGRMDFRVVACETVPLGNDVDLEAAVKIMGDRIRPLASSRIRCLVSLPPADIMFRRIRLPFREESKIKKTLPFELEPLLPLPIEEVVADYVSLPGDGLLVAATGKERIRKVISAVEAHLGGVSAIDIAAAALVLPCLEPKASVGMGILLDVGASSTVAVFYEENAIVQIRSFAFGGNTISEALAKDWSCGLPQAEQIKISAAYGAKTGEALAACRQFCGLLANTIEFLRLNEMLHHPQAKITVTGGGSLFGPLLEELGKAFGGPVEILDAGRFGFSPMDETVQQSCEPATMTTALATVKRAFTSRKSFNFRQGEFAAGRVHGDLRKQVTRGAIIAGIILFLAVVDQVLDYRLQAQKSGALKNQISLIFKKHYSPAAVMVDPVTQLKTKLAEDRKMYGMDQSASGLTVLSLLKEISGLIAPALDIVVTHLHYENNIVLVKGEARKIDDVTAVKNELVKSKYFKTVAIGATSLAKDGVRVDFDLRIELR